jgi:hypothetical protein
MKRIINDIQVHIIVSATQCPSADSAFPNSHGYL